MRNVFKPRSIHLTQPEGFITSQALKLQNFHSKSSKNSKKEKIQDTRTRKTDKHPTDIVSIFSKITEIIGTENFSSENKGSFGFSASQEPHLKANEQLAHCTPFACRNDKESTELGTEEKMVSQETQLRESAEIDISPIVHEITKIVRAENAAISMEERLENAHFVYDSDIVEKVLKRCFKVDHLALRFFNWLKRGMGFRHTTATYNTMIFIAGEAKEFNLVEELVEEMEKESCPKDVKTWTILISCCGKANMIGKALLVFEKLRKSGLEPDGRTYKLIVCALCNARKAEIAMEFYKEMVGKKIEVDISLYKLLLDCLSKSGDTLGVRLVGDDMVNVSQIPEQKVYSCMLRSFCISGSIREALELLHELKNKNIMLDPENFEILVKGLCRDGKISDALEIVEIMKRTRVVDGKVYGIIINGYLRKHDVSKAFELFDDIKKSGHFPTVSTYTELMQHLFSSDEYDRACKLYEEMLANGLEPDIVAMTALVAGHIQYNRVSEAWGVLEVMKKKGIKVTHKSYSLFIKELCKVSRPDEALKLVNEMRDAKMNIADEIFHFVMLALERKGELEKAETVKQMWRPYKLYGRENKLGGVPVSHQSPGDTDISKPVKGNQELISNEIQLGRDDGHPIKLLPKVYTDHDLLEICNILSSSRDWSSTQETLEKCTVQFTSDLVLEVLHSCQSHGHAALRFFSWVGQQAGYKHTTETYNMAIKISGSAKDFKHMRNLYFEMRRKGYLITPDTWTIMIMQYGRAGLTEISLKKFEEMKADGCKPNGSTYKFLIMYLCEKKGRKVDKAIKFFHEMINARLVPDKELVEIYLNCLCEVGKLSDARRCVDSLPKFGYALPLSYSLVVRSLCRAGRLEEALALVAEMGEAHSTLDQYVYGSLVHGLLRAGRVEEALAKVEAMKLQGIYPTVHVYTSLIVHFFREKQIGKALEIFKKMREEGCEPTIVTFSALIRGYMNVGMFLDARNVFHRIKLKGPYPDFKTYSMFMSSLCKMGQSEEALQLINEMLDDGIFPSIVNFRTVFYGLNREGKQDLAQTVLQKKWDLMSKRKFLT